MSRLSDTTFPNPFFLAVKMRCITSMDIKIFTNDVAGQCVPPWDYSWWGEFFQKNTLRTRKKS